jgi:tetratricopeptide (TPR) repeat protein
MTLPSISIRQESATVTKARNILRDQEQAPPPNELLSLAQQLKAEKVFGLARQLLARARQDPVLDVDQKLRLKVVQQHALCTYKDLDLPPDAKLDRAFEILEETGEDLHTTRDQETLGIAGAICKRRWEVDGQIQHLERALAYYQRGYREGLTGDYGYTAINAAFVLDLLADQEAAAARRSGAASMRAAQRCQEARSIREDIAATLPNLPREQNQDWLEQEWWFLATIAEACFGLGRYDEAGQWLKKALATPEIPSWQLESTVRQFIWLAQLSCEPSGKPIDTEDNPAFTRLVDLFQVSPEAVRGILAGKIGLALSGGGFRASLFHIGVLAKLAEYDALRHVEVLSCVSGGSIIGAHYYLEVRHLLQTKPDGQISRQDYIDLVRRLENDFLAGVQRNIRTRVAADWSSNLKMIFKPNYSRTERVGELFETELYRQVEDGEEREPRWLNNLFVQPADAPENFTPREGNWCRGAKVPILILNATTLNTGHNWQFTASWMGEPPAGITSEIDGNDRLRRLYYDQAPEPHRNIRLGHAVAASACVPGLFEPLALDGLYPDRIVRLVDGGVHDNQGVAGLLEESCAIMLISDASGQMESQNRPKAGLLSVPLRSNSILMSRVREAEFREVDARRRSALLRAFMFVHLKKDLNVEPVPWNTCNEPPDPDVKFAATPPGAMTNYGLPTGVQKKLASIRTDLDSFSDMEAYALMTSGYRMAEHEYAKYIRPLLTVAEEPVDWRFLDIEKAMNAAPGYENEHRQLLKILQVASSKGFKVWKLKPWLQVLSGLAVAALLGLLYKIFSWDWSFSLITGGGIVKAIIATVAIAIVGLILVRTISHRKTLSEIGIGIGMALFGFAAALLHLRFFDPLYLKMGRMNQTQKKS